MNGYFSRTIVVGSGGPGQAPVFITNSQLSINYVGGVNIRVRSLSFWLALIFTYRRLMLGTITRLAPTHMALATPTSPNRSPGLQTLTAFQTSGLDVQLTMKEGITLLEQPAALMDPATPFLLAVLISLVREISTPARFERASRTWFDVCQIDNKLERIEGILYLNRKEW